jgi:hypothetical protein
MAVSALCVNKVSIRRRTLLPVVCQATVALVLRGSRAVMGLAGPPPRPLARSR